MQAGEHAANETTEAGNTGPTPPPPRATAEQIRHMARAVLDQRLIHGAMINPSDIGMVFLPLSLLTREQIEQMRHEDWDKYLPVGIIGEHFTMGSSFNGWPIFGEFVWRHRLDVRAAVDLAEKMEEYLGVLPIPPVD